MTGQSRFDPPFCVELFAGTFGWSAGWLALGGQAIGFDLEHEAWHGPVPENALLVLQDVLTLDGAQFKDADLILASPPCQEFSYRAMPWKRAKALPPPELGMALFWACFRIQREACLAAGRHIPMVVENVCGAQQWVGRARWHFGSYYLWGDVPALMPAVARRTKNGGGSWFSDSNGAEIARNDPRDAHLNRQFKNAGGSWFAVSHNNVPHTRGDAIKGGGDWFSSGAGMSLQRRQSSKSNARRAASAMIARIPDRLSQWIAECYWPTDRTAAVSA